MEHEKPGDWVARYYGRFRISNDRFVHVTGLDGLLIEIEQHRTALREIGRRMIQAVDWWQQKEGGE